MPLTAKQRKYLELIRAATDSGGGMYSGERVDLLPGKIVSQLDCAGFVTWVFPHNPVHKERLQITEAGRKALASA